jgi:hypothetical protein
MASIGTEYLIIILLWCGDPKMGEWLGTSPAVTCRREAIKCVRNLKNFTTDDVIKQCLK